MIELKTQLPILTYPDGLKTFVADQTNRRARVKALIDAASVAVDKARKDIKVPELGHDKRVGAATVKVLDMELRQNTQILTKAARLQTIQIISDIRAGMDKEVVPLIKAMNVASDTAKEYAARHFDKYSVLRRARGTTSNLMESVQLRAMYAEILGNIEPRELAAFAQQAIDSGDPILADAVARRNFTIPRNDRAFTNQAFLALVPNAEFDTAQAQLATVTMLYEQATVQYATFGREVGAASLQRMNYGLNYGNVKLNEDGSINPQGAE